jgi:hypothetical protein
MALPVPHRMFASAPSNVDLDHVRSIGLPAVKRVSAPEYDTFSGPPTAKCPVDGFGPSSNTALPAKSLKARKKVRTFWCLFVTARDSRDCLPSAQSTPNDVVIIAQAFQAMPSVLDQQK